MSALAKLMERFHEAILTKDSAPALSDLAAHPRMTQAQQMNIYIEGYRIRLVQAIRSDYPALLAYLGDAAFDALALDYIEKNPPAHFNLDRYPHAFADCVHEGFAADLARLESAIAEVFMLDESEPLLPETMAGLSPEAFGSLTLRLRTASRLVRFHTPVEEWFCAQRDGKTLSAPAPQETCILIWRHKHEVRRAELTEAAYLLLQELQNGCTVEQALENVVAGGHEEAIASGLQSWFAQWLAEGCFAFIPSPSP